MLVTWSLTHVFLSLQNRKTEVSRLMCSDETMEEPEKYCRCDFWFNLVG